MGMCGSRKVLSKDVGGVGDSASRIDSVFCKYCTVCTCPLAFANVFASICVLIRVWGGGHLITANTYKSPIQAPSLRTVPSCDKPAAYRVASKT